MRIAITALGAVFPGGKGGDALRRALEAGTSLTRPSHLDAGVLAAVVEESLKSLVPRKGLAALSRSALLAAASIEDLIQSCRGIAPENAPGECGLVAGTAFGHVESKAEFHAVARRDGVRLVSPILFPNTIINSLAGHAAILYQLTGPNSTVTSGRRSGLEALLRAGCLLRAGRARRVVVVGCDELSPTLLRALQAESGGSAPLAAGEAAVAFLLEPAGEAEALARPALAWVRGAAEANAVGRSLSATVEKAMRSALAGAGASPGEVAWLALSAGGGAELDAAEEEAVRAVFGEGKPAAALKRIFGETFGAAGGLAVAAAVLHRGAPFIPATPQAALRARAPAAAPAPFTLAAVPRPAPAGPVLVSQVEESGATCVLLEPAGCPGRS